MSQLTFWLTRHADLQEEVEEVRRFSARERAESADALRKLQRKFDEYKTVASETIGELQTTAALLEAHVLFSKIRSHFKN